MASSNIINAVFGSGICAVTTSAFRANYGMKLRFSGIDLPTAFEVDFSNYDVAGRDSITAIGQNGEVQIPDDLWDSGLNIYAYVYLHPTDDSGVTVYTVTIPVLGRPNRTEETPTPHEQSVIEQAISALNDAVEQTAADVASADASAQAAALSEANAESSERAAAASASAALASQNAAESAAQSATESASGASESARDAANSASQAAQSATSAQASAEQAERSVQSITDDVERAERAAAMATGKATEAAQSATDANTSAEFASAWAANAAEAVTDAQEYANDAEQAKTDAQDAKQAAEAAQSAAEQAKDDAESAADRAEQAEQEVLSAMDGTYENLTSGNAQQLLSTVTEANSVPYLFRPTASNADRAYLDEVVGGTVAWNQLLDVAIVANANGLSYTNTSNGHIVISGTTNAVNFKNFFMERNTARTGHVILLAASKAFPEGMSFGVSYVANNRQYKIETASVSSGNMYARFAYNTGIEVNYDGYINIFDLTEMFGSAIADYIYSLGNTNGVAYFRKLFPNDYYEYNSGELLSVEGVSAKRTVGFNQWDEEWEVGGLSTSDGQPSANNNAIRSKNFIPCLPNTAYYTKSVNPACYLWFYDGDKNFLSFVTNNVNKTVTTPSNCRYMKLRVGDLNNPLQTYNYNICINLSDPVRNGTYEPYTKRTYPLDSSLTLRGVPKLDASGNLYYDGDTYAPDGTVTRKYGVVDMGSLAYVYDTSTSHTHFLVAPQNFPAKPKFKGGLICTKFIGTTKSYSTINNLEMCVDNSEETPVFRVRDDSYTSAAAFKSAMSGVMLVYELATPTTETAEPYRHLQICDPNGTEEFVSTGIVPVGHNTRYPENLRAKIEGLPWNFNSIIAMTETTTTASKAYSVGDYFILNNVLYRVTSAIASGGTITIGTNCRATTIMDEIKALS